MVQVNRRDFPGGHTRIANWFVRFAMPRLAPGEIRVYLVLAHLERVHEDGREYAFASTVKLAEWTAMSERQVIRSVDRLLELELIYQIGTPRRGRASEYGIRRTRPDQVTKGDTHVTPNRSRKGDTGVRLADMGVHDTPRELDTGVTPYIQTAHEPAAKPSGVADGDHSEWFVEREATPGEPPTAARSGARSLTRFPGRFLCVDHAAISAAV